MDIVTSRLVFPKATVSYCAVRYAGAKAIMAAIPEAT
jgi:hypothetical protein